MEIAANTVADGRSVGKGAPSNAGRICQIGEFRGQRRLRALVGGAYRMKRRSDLPGLE